MKRYIRYMDNKQLWPDYINDNQLTGRFLNSSNEENGNFSFIVQDEDRILSIVHLKLATPYLIEDDSNITIKSFYFRLKEIFPALEELTIHQKLFMSYINEEESKLLNLKIGNPILFLQKEYFLKDKLFLQEDEVSLLDAYIFKERYLHD